jgi:hypothetical protein
VAPQESDRSEDGRGARTESVDLLLRGDDVWWEEAAEAEPVPLRHRERRTLHHQQKQQDQNPKPNPSLTRTRAGITEGTDARTRLYQGSWRMSGPRLWRTTGRWHSAVRYPRGAGHKRRHTRSAARDRRRFRERDAIPRRGDFSCRCFPWVRALPVEAEHLFVFPVRRRRCIRIILRSCTGPGLWATTRGLLLPEEEDRMCPVG